MPIFKPMHWLILVLVSVPTAVALYYMSKAKQRPPKEVIIKVELDESELPTNTTATQTEWEFKQYHKN